MVIPSFSLVEASHIASGLWANGVATKSFPSESQVIHIKFTNPFSLNNEDLNVAIMKVCFFSSCYTADLSFEYY